MFFLLVMVFFFGVLCSLVVNYLMWWCVFLLMTMIFLLVCKGVGSYYSVFNYFVLQEILGLLFLLFSDSLLQYCILMMKVGVPPFHFWVLSVMNSVYDYGFFWYLFVQKFPYLFVLDSLFVMDYIYVYFLGLVFCYFHLMMVKGMKGVVLLLSMESVCWCVMSLSVSVLTYYYLFLYYIVVSGFMISSLGLNSYFYSDWLLLLSMMNMPFTMGFFYKLYMIGEMLFYFSFFVFFFVFLFLMYYYTLGFWFLGVVSLDGNYTGLNCVYLFLPLVLFVFVLLYVL